MADAADSKSAEVTPRVGSSPTFGTWLLVFEETNIDMSTLKATIETLAADFAKSLIMAIKSASLQEILHETGGHASSSMGSMGGAASSASRGRSGKPGRKPAAVAVETPKAAAAAPARAGGRKGKGGRLPRRSASDLAKAKEQIISLLSKHPKGLRSEEIRSKLGLSKQEIPRPLADALTEKLITKKGEKRATTYYKK